YSSLSLFLSLSPFLHRGLCCSSSSSFKTLPSFPVADPFTVLSPSVFLFHIMRIRKNASHMSGPAAAAAMPPETTAHVICQLNQSPWDLIPSSSSYYSAAAAHPDSFPSPSYFLLNRQFQAGEGSNITGNGSLDGSVGGGESVASMMEDDTDGGDQKAEDGEESTEADVFNYHDNVNGNNGAASRWTTRRGGRVVSASHGKTAANNTTSSGRRGGRAKAAKKGAAAAASMSSDPNEFYYYSGFGPLWGKRRGGHRAGAGGGDEANNNNISYASSGGTGPAAGPSRANSSSPPLAAFDFIDEDYDFDEEEEEDLDGAAGGDFISKKRMRKPVKARSLKSLM
ncbi:unnamed protein product, partial [Linum tenue]